uniref:Glucose-6-phosphate isomerase n=1 Tax=Desulfatirhabdium butyrativorans TaxID=340467 RepID=A0A7C4MM71_9BACT
MKVPVHQTAAWKALEAEANEMAKPDRHLALLLKDETRAQWARIEGAGILLDVTRQRITRTTLDRLTALAHQQNALGRLRAMADGEIVNTTEKRAALHMACRDFSGRSIRVNGEDVIPEIASVRDKVRDFSEAIRSGRIRGAKGKPFRDIVVIGIGGSYLGTEFVGKALEAYADPSYRMHYLANVDGNQFGAITRLIDPEATLWIVVSKSYTTAETLANEALARHFMKERGLDPTNHIVTVTAKGSPGDDPKNPVLATFHMFDFIGGRYSVSSAVGAVPLSILLGYDVFERFLKGAEAMDRHALDTEAQGNLPLMAALLSIWNTNFLGYPAQGIIPYAAPLAKLAAHIQQLDMESNGKMVCLNGEVVGFDTGPILFGEPGTNAQHSFFQLAHQGRAFPIDFIGVVKPQYAVEPVLTKGVTNHEELWANLLSQVMALAVGKQEGSDPFRYFPGNRPSSLIVLPDLSPESVGKLLAFYEARTVFQAFIWATNPFDQFGVELGKTMADTLRRAMVRRKKETSYGFEDASPYDRPYLKALFDR